MSGFALLPGAQARVRSTARRALVPFLLAMLLGAPLAALDADADAAADAAKAPSPLRLAAVDVQPEQPTPDTLCKLQVTLANDGEQPISGLRFAVTVHGQPLPVYDRQVFLEVVPAGGEVVVPLYNFWVTETGRALPEKGPLRVEVRVTEARWTRVEMEPLAPEPAGGGPGDAAANETVETWTLLEPLATLPDPVVATRELRRP